ncbi:hypothetical protein D7030_02890 [Flavobacteriaceae bacterium AU392]|nr:hypothetical protein D1817_09365 [Flavobacteriaceae bacterium]RKM85634.1 hypothetical protein D7030_02890 [Flavobacteriaceae bacterium AU392]
MDKTNFTYLFFCFIVITQSVKAQDPFEELDKELQKITRYTQATFKANRITFGQSVETRKKGILEFNVRTKYWNMPDSQTQNFGADFVTARFGIDYAITDRFTTGFGVGTFDGIFNGYGKYRLVRQKDSDKKAPIGITLFQSTSYQSRSFNHIDLQNSISDRLSFATQVILARKFDSNFSFQLTPTFIRRNSDQFAGEPNNHFALGFGVRYKVANHVSIASEYYYVANPIEDTHLSFFGPFALGVNWDIRNVIVQFSLTNTRNFAETANVVNTFNNFNFNNGNLHIGVSLTYALHLKKKKL